VFSIGSDHKDIGQIQARQMCALLPTGGLVLYIQGPSYAHAAQNRTVGMMQVKSANIQLRSIKADWTEEGACKAVTSWLRLSTSHELAVAAIVSQNDLMAKGARKAFQQQTAGVELDRWMKLPYLGCDGLRQTGMAWVRSGLLTGTVVIPGLRHGG
jgi:ribose transport system substrate-binding protein